MIHINVTFPWWYVPLFIAGWCAGAYVHGYVSEYIRIKRMTDEERRTYLSS